MQSRDEWVTPFVGQIRNIGVNITSIVLTGQTHKDLKQIYFIKFFSDFKIFIDCKLL